MWEQLLQMFNGQVAPEMLAAQLAQKADPGGLQQILAGAGANPGGLDLAGIGAAPGSIPGQSPLPIPQIPNPPGFGPNPNSPIQPNPDGTLAPIPGLGPDTGGLGLAGIMNPQQGGLPSRQPGTLTTEQAMSLMKMGQPQQDSGRIPQAPAVAAQPTRQVQFANMAVPMANARPPSLAQLLHGR